MSVPVAWVLARFRFAGRGLLLRLLMLPFVVPTLVAAMGVLALWGGEDIASLRDALKRAHAHDGLALVHVPVGRVRTHSPRVVEEMAREMAETPKTSGGGAADLFGNIEWKDKEGVERTVVTAVPKRGATTAGMPCTCIRSWQIAYPLRRIGRTWRLPVKKPFWDSLIH